MVVESFGGCQPARVPVEPGATECPDHSKFAQTIETWAVKVHIGDSIGKALKVGKECNVLLNLPMVKTIVNHPAQSNFRLLLLSPYEINPALTKEGVVEELREKFTVFYQTVHAESKGIHKEMSDDEIDEEFVERFTLTLDWEMWSTEQILTSVLPEGSEVPSSYETIGHIAHLNLKDELLPYRYIIGKVILEKSRGLSTVINKLDSIETVFRTFKMEVLAGEANFYAAVRESNCTFKFDFSEVYWNSRLQTEHLRLVETYFRKDDILLDGCAGIGPFAIPASKNKNIFALANDLNPASHKYLLSNIKSNGVSKFVQAYNMDANDFIIYSSKELSSITAPGGGWEKTQRFIEERKVNESNKQKKRKIQSTEQEESSKADKPTININIPSNFRVHYVFNLPGHARNFLAKFKEAQYPSNIEVYVHIYTFHRPEYEPVPKLVENLWRCLYVTPEADEQSIQTTGSPSQIEIPANQWEAESPKDYYNGEKPTVSDIPRGQCKVWRVRNVAPGKEMVCASFVLPKFN